jgi:hypothetical protein
MKRTQDALLYINIFLTKPSHEILLGVVRLMTLFAGHAPKLHSITLVKAMLSPRSPLYSTITALTLAISDDCAQL